MDNPKFKNISAEKILSAKSSVEMKQYLAVPNVAKTYRVGTLIYTTKGLAILFLWLLWGDFCYTILEAVVPRVLPLLMKSLDASNQLIGTISSSISAIINITILPAFCIMSDRYRGRFGRRIPFLLITSPFAAFFLVLIGYSDVLGAWLHGDIVSHFCQTSPRVVILIFLCCIVALFHLFNALMSSMYNFLLVDVVPPEIMGRFMSCFKAITNLAIVIFSRYIFGKWETYQHEIFLCIGTVYLVTFLLICWRVKEGEYPPVPRTHKKNNLFGAIKNYSQECFSAPLYLWFFLLMVFLTIVGCTAPFSPLFMKEILKMTMDDIGKFIGWVYLCSALFMIPAGFICDKLHPVRITPFVLAITACLHFGCYLGVHDQTSLYILGLILMIPGSIYTVSVPILSMTLLPKEKYGQYMSAMGIITALGVIAGNYLAGLFFDLFQNDYQLIYIWSFFFEVLATICGIMIYIEWKRHGGMKNYVPPQAKVG